jgi:DNA mismatch repair protein MutS
LNATEKVQGLLESLPSQQRKLWYDFLKAGDACRAIQQKLAETLVENPQNLGSGRLVFRTGFDKVLDQCVALLANGEEAIEAFEQRERQRTGISSLKVKHHKNFGYLIEITKSNIAKTPPDYHRRQTMVNNERFVCAELLDLGQELETADSRAQAREAELYELLLGDLSEHSEPVRNLALALADLDVFQSLALRAKKFGYIRPKFSSKGDVNLRASRHPVLEELLGQHCCVANDIALHDPIRQFLITGPNMAGKSTIMRQLALIAIMHQIGSYVPAAEAELPVFDRLFTRVGASDDLALGQSTFMIEMSEAACVLREATRRSLVILDEVGRGTSTDDGLAIAAAIFDDVIRRIGCVTLFATHYHELVPMTAEYPSVAPMQIEVIPTAEGVKFTHKFKVGAAGESFGIEVAKIAGIPTQVVQSALAHLQAFAQKRDTQPPSKVASVLPVPIVREATGAGDLRERLLRLNLDRLTPLKALILLGDWQQQARGIRGASRGQASLFPDQIS